MGTRSCGKKHNINTRMRSRANPSIIQANMHNAHTDRTHRQAFAHAYMQRETSRCNMHKTSTGNSSPGKTHILQVPPNAAASRSSGQCPRCSPQPCSVPGPAITSQSRLPAGKASPPSPRTDPSRCRALTAVRCGCLPDQAQRTEPGRLPCGASRANQQTPSSQHLRPAHFRRPQPIYGLDSVLFPSTNQTLPR